MVIRVSTVITLRIYELQHMTSCTVMPLALEFDSVVHTLKLEFEEFNTVEILVFLNDCARNDARNIPLGFRKILARKIPIPVSSSLRVI